MAGSESSAEDRDLPASEKRLADAAREGNVPRSRDVAHVLVGGAVVSMVYGLAGPWHQGLRALLQVTATFDGGVRQSIQPYWERTVAAAWNALWPLLATLLAGAAAAVVASMVPGGFHLAEKPLKVDVSRINPMSGFSRIASMGQVVEVGKAVLLTALMGLVGYWYVSRNLGELGALSLGSLEPVIPVVSAVVLGGIALMLMVLGGIAVLDVPWQWWHHRHKLKMSREEAKQEHKESEGDPMVKGRIRQRQREAAQRRMMAAVPASDVVLVNPVHYAVALRYDAAAAGAPVVVARGVDAVAQRIQAIARENGVPVLRAAPLARALYTHVRLDAEVPGELYVVIAQVLSWVHQLRRWVPGRDAVPAEPQNLEVPAALFVPAAADTESGRLS